MLSSMKNMFKVPDLRNKILFTLLMIGLYRLGSHVPVPGIDVGALKDLQKQAVNLDILEATGLSEITPADLHANGLISKGALVKVLGRGEVTRAITVRAHGFSKSAEAAITAAGGTVETLPLPWGDRRPPAKGNQHTNR